MSKQQAKMHANARRREMPVYAGRGGGFHKDKSKYTRKTKHKDKDYG